MRQKKIALINDITGFGRCSVAVMAPIVSAMKIQAVAVPTAILSTHTQFPEYYFDDYTPRMRDYIQTYKNLNMEFDGIATGFLESEEQVDIVIDFIQSFGTKDSMILVDPVMGDYGKLYKTYTPQMCDKMKGLVQYANILTPNLTKLCTLLDTNYGNTIHNLVKLTPSVSPTASHLPQRGRQYPAPSLRELSAKLTEGVLKLWIVIMEMANSALMSWKKYQFAYSSVFCRFMRIEELADGTQNLL